MKNYFEQVAELEITKIRLEVKKQQKENLYIKHFPVTSKIKEISAHTESNPDKVILYLAELEDTGLSQELEKLQNDVNMLEYEKKKMEEYLIMLEGVQYDFIKLRYYEEHHYTLEEIAEKLGYSHIRIKQISAEMENKIKEEYTNKTLH